MKIECSHEQLAVALNKTDRIAGKNATLPILSCVCIDATADKVLLRATNLEIALEVIIPAKIHEKGVVAIPSHTITSYINTLDKSKTVTLELVGGNVRIVSAHNNTIIKAQPHADFPAIPAIEEAVSFSIKPSLITEGIKAVFYSAGQSSMKPELSSIYMHSHDNLLTFVATDSFRLAEKKIKAKTTPDEWSTLVPVKNIADIVRVLDDVDTDVEVMVTKHQMIMRTPHIYLTSRVVEGSFPDYKQIIPKDSKTEATVLKQDLLQAFKVATIFSDKFNKLNIQAVPSKKKVFIKTSNSDIGETVTELGATLTGDDVDINFNYKYISECMQSIGSASVVFRFNGATKLVIQGVGDTSFLYLVMPMNR